MVPHIQIFLWQMLRNKARLALNLVLLCAATAFFVISLNLYQNSWANLQTVEDTYSTIATMEIYGDVNEAGELVRPGDADNVGRFLLTRYGYDLSPLQELSMVQSIDLRYRCAAYIPRQLSLDAYASEWLTEEQLGPSGYRADDVRIGQSYHMLRFRLSGTEPVTIDLTKESKRYSNMAEAVLDITVLDSAHPQIQYSETIGLLLPLMTDAERDDHGAEVQRLNRTQDTNTLTFYPGVEYVMHGAFNYSSYYRRDPDTGLFSETDAVKVIDGVPVPMYFGLWESGCISQDRVLMYRKTGAFFSYVEPENVPYFIQRWEDVQNDPEEAAYFDALWQATEYSASSFAVTLTSDITQVPAWHTGGMFLHEGRMITKEEYQAGAKVCMISAMLADKQGWKLGDTLDLHLYAYEHLQYEGTYADTGIDRSMYLDGFFDEGQYEIVGIYGQREIVDTGDTAPEVFAQPWNVIYIPENSAPNAPALEERPIQASLLTIKLKNGSIDEFKAAVEEMGLTVQKTGEYEIKFSYFDQGYGKIAGGLQEMNRNARLLLGLSAALLLVTMILMAFLFSRQHKHSAGILRMLGGSKKQAFTAILACAAVVVLAGGALGTILGGALTQSVGASILGDAAASAKVALSTGASPVLTALSGLGCVVLFLALTAIFTVTYIGKEPRALLPEDKG